MISICSSYVLLYFFMVKPWYVHGQVPPPEHRVARYFSVPDSTPDRADSDAKADSEDEPDWGYSGEPKADSEPDNADSEPDELTANQTMPTASQLTASQTTTASQLTSFFFKASGLTERQKRRKRRLLTVSYLKERERQREEKRRWRRRQEKKARQKVPTASQMPTASRMPTASQTWPTASQMPTASLTRTASQTLTTSQTTSGQRKAIDYMLSLSELKRPWKKMRAEERRAWRALAINGDPRSSTRPTNQMGEAPCAASRGGEASRRGGEASRGGDASRGGEASRGGAANREPGGTLHLTDYVATPADPIAAAALTMIKDLKRRGDY